IPNIYMLHDAFPTSDSPLLNVRLLINVATPKPKEGVHTATATIPITAYLPSAINAEPNKNATLFTGPPISKAIIAPTINAKIIIFVPCILFNQVVNPSKILAIGAPIKKLKINPTINEEMIGIIMIGIIVAIAIGTLIFFIHFTIYSAKYPATISYKNPPPASLP